MASFMSRKDDKVSPLIRANTTAGREHCTRAHFSSSVHAVYVQISYTKRRCSVLHVTTHYNLVCGWTMFSWQYTRIL